LVHLFLSLRSERLGVSSRLARSLRVTNLQKMDSCVNFSPEAPERLTKSEISKKIRETVKSSLFVAQVCGFFPFVITQKNKIKLSLKSISFWNLVIQTVLNCICGVFCILSSEHNENLLKDWSLTEKFAYGTVFNIINLSQIIIRLFCVFLYKDIQGFYKKLDSVLTGVFFDFLQSDTSLGCNGSFLTAFFHKFKKPFGYLLCFLIFMEAFVVVSILILGHRMGAGNMDISTIEKGIVISAMAICTIKGVFYSAFTYWLVSLINCMCMGFAVLEKSFEVSNRMEITKSCIISSRNHYLSNPSIKHQEESLLLYTSNHSKLASLVKAFNHTFKHHFIINMLGCCCSGVIHTFIFLNSMSKEGIGFGTILMFLWILLDATSIFYVCDASGKLEMQVVNVRSAVTVFNFLISILNRLFVLCTKGFEV
jgi:hypothetical protein